MLRKLFITGTNGQAKETAQLARQIDPHGERWAEIIYVTHDTTLLGQRLPYGNVSALDDDLLALTSPADVALGVGHPGLRQKIVTKLMQNPNLAFPNLVHPSVEIDPEFVRLGQGNMMTKGVVMTCDIVLGDFNLLNWNSTIGHDCRMGDFNVINPSSSISGCVSIGDACLLGTGARILQNLSICSNAIIGAGAVITKNIDEAGVYIGIPARRKT